MSLSYLGTDLAGSGPSGKQRFDRFAAQLVQQKSRLAAAAWRSLAAPHVLPAMLRVVSALALSYWLVQLVKHHVS